MVKKFDWLQFNPLLVKAFCTLCNQNENTNSNFRHKKEQRASKFMFFHEHLNSQARNKAIWVRKKVHKY
jgi:hypothetical protein